jgi:hypothetical protein
MRPLLVVLVLVPGTLSAGKDINISVCNTGGLPSSALARGEASVEAAFQPLGLRVTWLRCDQHPRDEGEGRWFTVRLRGDSPLRRATCSSLDAMGRAYIGGNGEGYLADIYLQPVTDFAAPYGADADALLGNVRVHELGHLFLGPGHSRAGVMRSGWTIRELMTLQQGHLQFTAPQRAVISHALDARVNATQTTDSHSSK